VSDNSWDAFITALATELSRLPDGAVVVIEDSGNRNHYAQFMQSSDSLRAEVASDPEPPAAISIPPATEERLRQSGWQPPDANGSLPNWSYDLPWPASWRDYQELAATMVAFLRDTLGIVAPTSMVHRSWINHTNEALELTALGIAAADPSET
jgi:hypothetical protein